MKWSEDQIELCKGLWLGGKLKSSREISAVLTAELGVEITFSAVIARMARSGLSHLGPGSNNVAKGPAKKPRRSELPPEDQDRARSAKRDRRARRSAEERERQGLPPKTMAVRTPVAPKPSKREAVEGLPPLLRIPFTQIRYGQCKQIAGDPMLDDSCCGHSTEPGKSYCPAHCRINYTPTRPNVSFPRTWSVR